MNTMRKLYMAIAASACWIGGAAAQVDGPDLPMEPVIVPVQAPIYFVQDAEKIPAPAAPMPAEGCCDSCCDTGCKKSQPPCVHCENKKKCCDICARCDIHCFKKWTCEDLKMAPFEPTPKCCGWKGCFHCPSDEEKKGCDCNGEEAKNGEEKKNGDKKNGEEKKNGDKKNGDKKNGNGEEKKNGEAEEEEAEEPEDLNLLMAIFECCDPCKFKCYKDKGNKVYGWIQAGFTGNADDPADRVNYGTNFNWRANDYRANQAPYIVFENTVDFEDKADFGYRIDLLGGHDAPILASNGLFDHVTGLDPFSGIGFEGPASFRNVYRYGFDIPQMYVEGYLPLCCGDVLKGVDVKIGKAYTSMGYELVPAISTDFYSHSYEFFYSVPFAHTGIFNTLKVTDTLDIMICVLRGWDVWEDNNQAVTYHGAFIWNSCDKRTNWTTAWITGPEQWEGDAGQGNANPDADDNYRTVVTSYLNHKFGCYNEWRAVIGGSYGSESNAVLNPVTGNLDDVEWYGASAYLFYTVSPKLTLGTRAEWFRDDDAARTAVYGRPGFDGNFYEVTLGVTYKPYQNLRIRPEIRYDWFNGDSPFVPGAQPYNDLGSDNQLTYGFDVIWEF